MISGTYALYIHVQIRIFQLASSPQLLFQRIQTLLALLLHLLDRQVDLLEVITVVVLEVELAYSSDAFDIVGARTGI
jgi:hypothetical protein